MASLRSILNTPIGGRKSRDSAGNRMGPEKPEGEKKRRFSFGSSGRYPEKTTINLLYREPDENRKFTLILFGVFLIFLILFTKFLVIDQLQRVNRAEARDNGMLTYLEPGQTREFNVTLELSDDPARIDTRMVRFKGLGLKSESLGPVMRHFHDRQVINIHVASAVGGAVLGLAGLLIAGRRWRGRRSGKAK